MKGFGENIITIDLNLISDANSLYQEFETELADFNILQHGGEAFCNAIVELVKKSKALIFYNLNEFKKYNFVDSELLSQTIFNLNHLDSGKKIIFDEYFEILQVQDIYSVSSIFEREPYQYGYRGDIYLWADLKSYFINKPVPENEERFVECLFEAIQALTDHSVIDGKSFHFKKYDHGGMSGGAICSEYWLNYLIPVLIGRYRILKKQVNYQSLNTQTNTMRTGSETGNVNNNSQ